MDKRAEHPRNAELAMNVQDGKLTFVMDASVKANLSIRSTAGQSIVTLRMPPNA